MNRKVESFIKTYVKELLDGNAAIFAGAGLSKGAGFVSWSELLEDIAEELGLQIKMESDLISLAQYHVNEKNSTHKISQKIVSEFATKAEYTLNHKILAKLPISTYWTTNYDSLIETSLKEADKIVDVKHQGKQFAITKPKRDAVVYKMHGDADHPQDVILTKEDYESYYLTHEPFITALNGDLISKTFLFIGFSFTDPNIDFILSRINTKFNKDMREHYCLIKKVMLGDWKCETQADLEYQQRKQELFIGELKRHRIEALLVEEYPQITEILAEIHKRFLKKTIFLSGSAEIYGGISKEIAQSFIHLLSKKIVEKDYTVVNGFGWGVGSAVINGALDAIYSRPNKFSEDQLIMRPFPQFETGDKALSVLWEEYRQKMISLSGVAIFIFGNKIVNGNINDANGVRREFEIARDQGLSLIPIGATGYESLNLWNDLMSDFDNYYPLHSKLKPLFEKLGDNDLLSTNYNELVEIILLILADITK